MSRILVPLIIVLLLLLAAGAYIASPLLTFQQLKAAARAGDSDRLAALMDFPAVRDDLKRQVDSKAVKLAREASGVSFPAVMALGRLGSMLGDRAIDKLVTPEAISAMLIWGRSPRDPTLPSVKASGASPSASMHWTFLSPDRFQVALAPNPQSHVAVVLIMQRQGLFSWRVEQIELPRYGRS